MPDLYQQWSADCVQRITTRMDDLLTLQQPLQEMRVVQAMRYSLLCTGKMIRPLLIFGVGKSKAEWERESSLLESLALSIEIIHTYSLIHDDLPDMDDAPKRRNQPSCHIAYEPTTAILVGDALQMLAIEVLTDCEADSKVKNDLVKALCQATGYKGMIMGQMLDLYPEEMQKAYIGLTHDSEKHASSPISLMHSLKTGKLISLAVQMPLLAFGQSGHYSESPLWEFGKVFGALFQLVDDIHDINEDVRVQNPNIAVELGLTKAHELRAEMADTCRNLLAQHDGDTSWLNWVLDRTLTPKGQELAGQ